MRGATSVLRRLAVLVALGLAVAVPAAAQTDPAQLTVTATSDHCDGGLPVVEVAVRGRRHDHVVPEPHQITGRREPREPSTYDDDVGIG